MFSFFKRKKSVPDQKPDDGVDIRQAEEISGEAEAPQEPAPEVLTEALGQAPDGDAAVETGAGEDTPDEAADAATVVAAGEPVAASALPEADAPVIEVQQPAVAQAAEAPLPDQNVAGLEERTAQEAPESVETVAPAVNAAPQQETAGHTQEKPGGSWLARLRKGLARTGQSIGGLFVGVKVDESLFEELETALLMADAGVEATESLLAALRARVKKDRLEDASQVREALRDILAQHLAPLEKPFPLDAAKPLIVMIAGVNGAGKTTSIGKLAHAFQAQGASVLLAAGDTFRAAAREQLIEWGARNDVTVIAQEGADPAAVAFDAVNAGRARGAHVVMVDTAGRLPTQLHLMEELKKIRRVIGKAQGDAPHEVLLVIDGNTGQNVLSQIRAFDAAIQLTGLVVTKLDGTAKGGTLAAVAAGSQGVRPVPVYWIGVGEGMHDLQPFVAREFAQALIGD